MDRPAGSATNEDARAPLDDPMRLRRASPLATLPLTLACYLVVGLAGWRLLSRPQAPEPARQPSVTLDLQDVAAGNGAPAPSRPAPPPRGGPAPPVPAAFPPRAETPSAALPPQPDTVPDQPLAELPSTDLSGAAVASGNGAGATGGTGGTGIPGGTGTGPGGGSGGTGTGHGAPPQMVEVDEKDIPLLFRPQFGAHDYPALARQRRVQGTVRVEFTVGVDGVPVAVRAVDGPALLRQGAEAMAARFRFRPQARNGAPVLLHLFMNIQFLLN